MPRPDQPDTRTAQRNRPIDDDAVPVMVPRSDKRLVPTASVRVQRLREHIGRVLAAMNEPNPASHVRPEPDGFAAEVVRAACTLCRGWCCRNGDDDAFLDARTIAQVRHARPDLDTTAILRLYVDHVPAEIYRESCIFHGKQGCTLDRAMRSDVCNSYFCGGLQAYLTGDEQSAPTVVIAGEGKTMQTSPVLRPKQGRQAN